MIGAVANSEPQVRSMRHVVVLVLASLTLVTSFWPGAAQADGGFGLLIEPEELEWASRCGWKGAIGPKAKSSYQPGS